ncbi:MAG: glycosyltransferase, partial [Anaerolineae bacterium]|nr:glycosyltransferase [Anaerolineae bacterium]
MNILHLYKDYFPVLGGIENHIRLLAQGLRARGVDARVLVTNTTRQTVGETIDGVPVTKTGRLLNISSAPISPGFYPELIRLNHWADLVHLHAPYPPGEIGQLFLGRRPFVLTYHSDIVRQKVMGFFYTPFLRWVLRRAERIVVSNPVYIQTSRFLRPRADKCEIIHYGIDLSRFARTPEIERRVAELRAQYSPPLILSVGKLRHYKGIDVLIEAMHQVDACALVSGDGPMGPAWRQKAQDEGLADRVLFLGRISEADLVALYLAADLFVLPSTNRAESWGIVQTEAMACGLPVVCTELGTGTSYVNQDGVTGLVVSPNNAVALAGALNTLLAAPDLRRRMGEAGRRRALTEFSQAAMIDRMLAFYKRVLDRQT